jgi:hypothetical protein
MAEIKYGFLQDPRMQDYLPVVSQALKTDSELRGLRKAAADALLRGGDERITRNEAHRRVDQELMSFADDVAEARRILNAIIRPEGSREAVGFVAVGVEGDEDQAPGADIPVEATQEQGLAERDAASIFEDTSNEKIAAAYADLFGVSPF